MDDQGGKLQRTRGIKDSRYQVCTSQISGARRLRKASAGEDRTTETSEDGYGFGRVTTRRDNGAYSGGRRSDCSGKTEGL